MPDIPTLANLVNGQLQPALDSAWLEVSEPATGKVHALCPRSNEADVNAAIEAATNAAPGWAHWPAERRAACLERLADLVAERLEEFAVAESRDTGKPVTLARRVDIPRAMANLRFYAAAVQTADGHSHAMGQRAINYTLRQPLGVVACISPWNLPLYLFTWKIAPALACGNTVVAKPSEVTPVTASMLGELVAAAGFPPGVLNIVHGTGSEVGEPLVRHRKVKALSFTGSTRTGARIAEAVAPQFKKVSLEMGGKNPAIVFADARLDDKAMDSIVRSGFSNQGEICLCGSRLLVQRAIYDEFKQRYLARVEALRVGDPEDPATDVGALVSEAHFNKVMGCIARARAEGGRILLGGEAVQPESRCAGGWFVQPTVIEGLPADCRSNQEEIFGPVVSLMPFEDEAEALALANGTDYGLAASLWTKNIDRAHRVAAELDFGIVWINCWMLRDLRTPFGGIKDSGLGREGGRDALEFFTEPKNICIRIGSA